MSSLGVFFKLFKCPFLKCWLLFSECQNWSYFYLQADVVNCVGDKIGHKMSSQLNFKELEVPPNLNEAHQSSISSCKSQNIAVCAGGKVSIDLHSFIASKAL